MPPLTLDHIGIAVRSLEEALKLYGALTREAKVVMEEVPSEGVRIAMLELEGARLELLEPLGEGPVARFLERRGPGLHHLALRVEDVERAMKEARAMGLQLLDEMPRRGFKGARVAFIHPKSCLGVLLELFEPP